MELEQAPNEPALASLEQSRDDRRPRLPEPPPVSLESVQDVTLPTVAGLEPALDAFYRDLLRFERVPAPAGADPAVGPVYRAENHELRFVVQEVPTEREGRRPIGIVTPFLTEIIEYLETEGIEHELVRGLVAGTDGGRLQDPAGNWVALVPLREIR